uniref:Uncharacterized protein n=1 Tax=viral metagenome TaxID=1070528 RepID=A0A6C0C6Z0_9ZZZZ
MKNELPERSLLILINKTLMYDIVVSIGFTLCVAIFSLLLTIFGYITSIRIATTNEIIFLTIILIVALALFCFVAGVYWESSYVYVQHHPVATTLNKQEFIFNDKWLPDDNGNHPILFPNSLIQIPNGTIFDLVTMQIEVINSDERVKDLRTDSIYQANTNEAPHEITKKTPIALPPGARMRLPTGTMYKKIIDGNKLKFLNGKDVVDILKEEINGVYVKSI